MSKRQFQISMRTIFAVVTVMTAYQQLPGGVELLVTVGLPLLIGGGVIGGLILIQWPIFALLTVGSSRQRWEEKHEPHCKVPLNERDLYR